jgi:Fusaric acid resistance protein-like
MPNASSLLDQVHWRQTLLAGPGMALIVVFGLVTGHLAEAAIGAGAALSVGITAGRSLGFFRWDSIVLIALGTPITSLVGSLAGEHTFFYSIGCFLAAGGVGAGSLGHPQFWLIYLQLAVAFIVGGHFPSDLSTAFSHSQIVFAGNVVEVICIALVGALFRESSKIMPPVATQTSAVSAMGFGLVVGTVVGATSLVAHVIGVPNVSWPTLTALIIMRPNLQNTQQRIWHRTFGTVAGCLIAFTLFSIAPHNSTYVGVMLVISLAAAFALQPSPRTSYGLFSAAITTSILLLLAFAQTDIVQDAELRLLSTLLGGAAAGLGGIVS